MALAALPAVAPQRAVVERFVDLMKDQTVSAIATAIFTYLKLETASVATKERFYQIIPSVYDEVFRPELIRCAGRIFSEKELQFAVDISGQGLLSAKEKHDKVLGVVFLNAVKALLPVMKATVLPDIKEQDHSESQEAREKAKYARQYVKLLQAQIRSPEVLQQFSQVLMSQLEDMRSAYPPIERNALGGQDAEACRRAVADFPRMCERTMLPLMFESVMETFSVQEMKAMMNVLLSSTGKKYNEKAGAEYQPAVDAMTPMPAGRMAAIVKERLGIA